ncbi:MAG: hypothetical protein PVH61_13995 [Candidatus Aminicenantes bacterium]
MRAKSETKNTAIMREVAAFGTPDNSELSGVRSVMILANRRRRPGPGSTTSFKYLALPTPGHSP